jgi:hypothetical protein
MKNYYGFVNDIHLYFGLLISPLILIFSVSVLVINHPGIFNLLLPRGEKTETQIQIRDIKILENNLMTAKAITQQLDIPGEIDWITKTDSSISFPVRQPGLQKYVSVDTRSGMATLTQTEEGVFRATVYLHMMPGQHNAMMRGNSFFMKGWRVITDVFVYVILFVSSTGVFLWYFLKPERKLGLAALAAGLSLLAAGMILLF